ncbi:MAG: 4-hydroxy-tetrahydrodipicolinate synthase [Clostridiales bacterium]|nr:4-hydroxy-tetrahydrodipicolinate synthase [Clostridiales bacterium]
MAKTLPFTGSAVAIVTPFLNDRETNYAELDRMIEMHIEKGTDAIVICGTTGEASCMMNLEHLEAIRHTCATVAGRIPVIAGTGSNDTMHAVMLSQKAQEYGADALLLVTPYYNKTSQRGLVKHFTTIAESVDIPCILYNVPSRTGMNISIPVLKELAKVDNIVGIKEASGNISYVAQIAAQIPELYIYSGNDDMIVPILSLGGKGVISVLANVAPAETHQMCQAYFDGDVKRSCELQLKYLDLCSSLFIETNPIPVKTAMRLMGYNVGDLRLPLIDMDESNKEKLVNSMKAVGLL